jgi:succinate-acetate transporter protein
MSESNQMREWSNPAPAGLVALAVACFIFFALLSGNVKPEAMPLLGCWLLGGFLVQVLVGIIELKGRNTTGGNTFLFFSAFFMLVSGIEMIFKFHMLTNGIAFDGRVDGWAWLALSIVLYMWTPAFFKAPLFLTLIILGLDVAVPLLSFMDMGLLPGTFKPVAAWALMFSGICGIYLSSAIIVNTAFGKKVYPLPGPVIK